jgi:hypothetical protein
MIDSLATIVLDFPGEANRARCLAHIVNLVVKIILRQFDVSKKKEKNNAPENNAPNIPDLAGDAPDQAREAGGEDDDAEIVEGDLDEIVRILDKEEKEMDEGDDDEDDEETEKLLRDVEMIEEAMEGEIREVMKTAKPVRQVLFKVCPVFFFSLSSFFFPDHPLPPLNLVCDPPVAPPSFFYTLFLFFFAFNSAQPCLRFPRGTFFFF